MEIKIQTGPKPISTKVAWGTLVLYLAFMAIVSWRLWLISRPIATKGGEVIQSVNSKNK